MSSDQAANQSFYSHGNNSTSSTHRFDKSNNNKSQVSSVGFYTLKKTNTNSSVSSTTSASTTKLNPLTKIFTKNRSNSTFNLNQGFTTVNSGIKDDDSLKDSFDENPKSSELKRISSAKFKLSNKLKLTSKSSSSKPDLTIQTSGHHGLKAPKKILSANQKDEKHNSQRKGSVSSPVTTIQNFFRTYNAPVGPSESKVSGSFKDDFISPQKNLSNNTRIAITLSSSNSNSHIIDPELASVFNFTDPDYSPEYVEALVDSKSLHELHKRMMLPADQFIQSKIYRGHQNDLHGSAKVDSEYEVDQSESSLTDSRKNDALFEELVYMMRPILKPSQNLKSASKSRNPHLGRSLESISRFILDNHIEEVTSEVIDKGQNKSPSKHIKAKFKNKSSIDNFKQVTTPRKDSEKFSDLKSRQILENVSMFFHKCITIFYKDYTTSYNKNKPLDPKGSVADSKIWLRNMWQVMYELWDYFNKHIRYRLLNMFYNLEKYLNDTRKKETINFEIVSNIEIESLLLSSYREVIVMPSLVERERLFDSFETLDKPETDGPHNNFGILKNFEIQQLNTLNGRKLSTIKNLFGVINSQGGDEYLRTDNNKPWNSTLFIRMLDWLQAM